MLRPTPYALRLTAAITVALAVAACAESTGETFGPAASGPRHSTTGVPDSVAVDSAARVDSIATAAPTVVADSSATAAAPHLLVCPVGTSYSDRRTIGPKGGSVGARGSRIYIPAGAVAQETDFELVVPAGQYMAVEIHAVGRESFTFAEPATIVINYARCPNDAVPTGGLAGAWINSATGQVLQVMGGRADRQGNKLSFSTGHLSGYAVAY